MLKRYDKVKYKNKIWLILSINKGDNTISLRDKEGNETRVSTLKIKRKVYNE